MNKSEIMQVILEQRESFERAGEIVPRDVPKTILDSPKIIAITGVRRCGKSTLLKQLARNYKDYNYINFEDERLLEFTFKDFNTVLESFLELNPATKTIFFDEIQNITGWEKFVRRLFTEGYKIFVTGSNARLLSSEIATSLTGRNLKVELYPFSFKEYLLFCGFPIKSIYITKERAELAKHLQDYVKYGGFPEVIKTKDYQELNELYQDIIIKDLIVRLKIRDTKDFRELALYLISNISKKMSYNGLKNILEFSSTSKVKNYVDFLSEAYLLFTVNKYDPSIKKQIVNDRKVYAIDQGIINAVAFQFSQNLGRLIENIVFIAMKRKYANLYYFEGKNECDIIIKEGTKITKAIQVTESLTDSAVKLREVNGLVEAANKFNLKEGTIITMDNEDQFIKDGIKIVVVPLWKWLLQTN